MNHMKMTISNGQEEKDRDLWMTDVLRYII